MIQQISILSFSNVYSKFQTCCVYVRDFLIIQSVFVCVSLSHNLFPVYCESKKAKYNEEGALITKRKKKRKGGEKAGGRKI